MLTDYFSAFAAAYTPYKGGPWCYEDGCLYRGLELLHRATGEPRWLEAMQRRVDVQIGDGTALAGYALSDYNIDNVLSGRALLYLDEVTGDPKYMAAAAILIDQLASHPRTKSGVYWHKLRYPWQVWLDGLYMGAPFQIGYGLRTGDDALVADAIAQVVTALEMTKVEATGLYAHAMDEARRQPWADRGTGHNKAHWSRALGWLAMALVDIAALVGPERFAPLEPQTRDLLARIAALRVPGGIWLQVIDRPDLDGNYEESSASAMFVYALEKGAALGLAEPPPADLFDILAAKVVRPRADGGQEMAEICEVAGLGYFENRFRDGSAEYYLTEARVADDIKGVGPLMMSYAAHLERRGAAARARVA
ncbi:glycoside hydrolase family 88/105 protein [Mangrovicoccus algicola]|uniref:Glycoside hydrolase family 88 protein n=1 Tax=Mangrovicoccus algicola TaxID=2771008 RepID=A0A8J6YUV9_9RHOB|nr:glycoside hydrolase family 88 protein [Mangrovicoccus algicola]MBE3638192.1 glycoside hydrolase family 88 protein [Mangrovicoccus algicola]